MKIRSQLLMGIAVLMMTACGGGADTKADKAADAASTAVDAAEQGAEKQAVTTASLDEILAAQSEENKARYKYRNPKETLEFFGIKPGMTVVEVLPGGGWYSKILLPYLGDEGQLIGVDYSLDMWSEFGSFADAAFLEKKKAWPQSWTEMAKEWRAGTNTEVSAFTLGNMDPALEGQVDAALFIRALHNLSRFEEKGGYLTAALKDIHTALKPGGIVGVVQHRAPEANSDEASTGKNGYIKQSSFVKQMEAAGFKLMGSSSINANPKDVPGNEEIVWRLPPALSGSEEGSELREKMLEIGESNRMTLLFKKL